MKAARLLAVLAVGTFSAACALFQGYPARSVHVIEPFGAGSGVDVVTRAVTGKLSELLGQPVSVENHAGAGGTVGPALVAKSRSDGYTLLANSSAHTYGAELLTKLAYDPLKDFIPIAPLANQPFVLVVGKSAGVKTVGELIVAAKTKPGEFKFGSAGVGTATHLGAEKFNLETGIKAIHVPLTPTQAISDTIAGRITYWMSPISLALPHIREGRLVALGVSSARRSSAGSSHRNDAHTATVEVGLRALSQGARRSAPGPLPLHDEVGHGCRVRQGGSQAHAADDPSRVSQRAPACSRRDQGRTHRDGSVRVHELPR